MSEMKRNFTKGKMNKDLDERLVAPGEYRHAMNIQVSTSEGSNVGAVQNILGNINGCEYVNETNPVYNGSSTIGSISDEKNDQLYWLVAGPIPDQISTYFPLDTDEFISFKDMIMRTNTTVKPMPISGCEPVFVDKYAFLLQYSGDIYSGDYIRLVNEDLYSNITVGMNVTGYNELGRVVFASQVTSVGSVRTLPVAYDYGFQPYDPPATTSTSSWSIRGFWNANVNNSNNPNQYNGMGATDGQYSQVFSQNGVTDWNPVTQATVATLSPPPVGGGNEYNIQLLRAGHDPLPPEWVVDINNPAIITNIFDDTGETFYSPTQLNQAYKITNIEFTNIVPTYALLDPNLGSGQSAYTVVTISPVNTYVATDFYFDDLETTTGVSNSWNAPVMAYEGLNVTVAYDPPVSSTLVPNNVITIVGAPSIQWLNDIYNIYYDETGQLTGNYLQIINNEGSGSTYPSNSCISADSVVDMVGFDPLNGVYDNVFEIVGCPGTPDEGVPMPRAATYNSRPLHFRIMGSAIDAIFLNEIVDLTNVHALYFQADKVLNFDKNRLITGINIVDDMLFWTDNFSEPKKINIERSLRGTDYSGEKHTIVINDELGYDMNGVEIPIREEHITVIRKNPKKTLTLSFDTGRNPDLIYSGILYTGDNSSPRGSSIISSSNTTIQDDFSSVVSGDTIRFNIPIDINNQSDFKLEWKNGDIVLLKQFSENNTAPAVPLSSHTVRGRLTNWHLQNFDTTINGLINVEIEVLSVNGIPPQPTAGQNLDYVIDLEEKEEPIFENKFPRFSYRYKYKDGEYSVFAPFSEVAFVPGSFNYDPKEGFNKGMVNRIKNITISDFVSQDLPTDVTEIDILYKEEVSPNIYLIETISPNDMVAQGSVSNAWHLNKYIINSETIKNVISSNQLLRSWDNVPKKALAQEVVGSRIVYGNYEQNYDLNNFTGKYKPDFKNSLTTWGTTTQGVAQKSIKSLRDYKLGVVFTDEYGRETPVLISESGGFKINKENSDKANRLIVGLKGFPPANMSYFKFFIKETSTEYYNLPMDRWYAAEDGNIWIAFPSSDRNKVDLDTTLFLKKGDDVNAIKNNSKYKILAIENEAPEFIKTRKVRIGTRTHDTTSIVDNTNPGDPIYANIFGTIDTPLLNVPKVNGISFDINYLEGQFAGTSMSNLEDIIEDLYINFRSNNDISSQYKVAELTSDYDSNEPRSISNPTKYSITVTTNFKEDINFIFDNPTAPLAIKDGIKIQFTKALVENSPKFEGRFFAKIKNDGKIKLNIDSNSNVNYVETTSKMIYSLEDDDALRERATNSLAGITADGCADMAVNPYYDDCPDNFITDFWGSHITASSHFPGTITGQSYDSTGINFNHYYSRVVYFSNRTVDGVGVAIGSGNTGTKNGQDFGWSGDDQSFGVWFIDKSTLKYKLDNINENLSWPKYSDPNDMAFASPHIDFWGTSYTGGAFTATNNTGNGVHIGTNEDGNPYSKIELAFGGIRGADFNLEGDLNDPNDPNNYNWFTQPDPNEHFFSIGNGNDYHNQEPIKLFVEKINSGFSFKWEHDPTETIYTIYDGFDSRHNLRFGKNDQGYSPIMSQFFVDPSSYHKTWGFKVTPSMQHWNPAGPTGSLVGDNGLDLGEKIYTKAMTFSANSNTLTCAAGIDTSNIKVGMIVHGTNIDTGTKVTNVLQSTSEILISKQTSSASTGSSDDISFGYTIRSISNNFVSYAGGECYVVVDEIQAECANNGGIYSLHKGMKLTKYNNDSSATGVSTTDENVIIKSIDPFDESLGPNGGYKIILTGQSKPLDVLNEFSTTMQPNERLRFQQVSMNSVSNHLEEMTDYTSSNWPNNDLGNPTAGIGAVGYRMIFVEPVEEYSDGGVLPPDPYIWETEPKEDNNIDLYYEISENNPIYLNSNTINTAIPLGSTIKTFSNEGGIGHLGDVTVVQNNFANGRTITISELAYVGANNLTSNSGIVIPPIQIGSILLITKPNGVTFGIQVAEVILNTAFTADTFVIEALIYHSNYKLNWHNCYSFGNGVESNRIRDAFNLPFIINGVKASTTLNEEYKLERRKSGLIYSGLYNSTSGINNLNQFIQAEKITKDLNPSYGSIQKLHTRDSNLVALCEDKILKILANKDAVFNADGNTQLTATENVLGQTIPFVGEYGISKNPESFASESYRAYFSDKVRGAIMRLSADGLTPISNHGMKSWFRDNLKISSKIIGSYDDRKDEYNVTLDINTEPFLLSRSNRSTTVTFREDVKGWVSFKSFTPENAISCANQYYTFNQGNLWRHHDENVDRNTFYNTSLYPSEITVLFNDAPGVIKTFHTLNYEGSQSRIIKRLSYDIFDPQSWDGIGYSTVLQTIQEGNYYNLENVKGWFAQDINTDLEQGSLKEFIKKEGKWFNYIHGKNGNLANVRGRMTSTSSSSVSFEGLGQMINSIVPQDVYGCTATSANNYNPAATIDDGSCNYTINGCTDSAATNYNSGANNNDGSCIYPGCTDLTAFNYDANANLDNGSCIATVNGCTDSSTLQEDDNTYNAFVNYDVNANTDDGSCIATVLGCIDPLAINYNTSANTQSLAGIGVCTYPILGCTDPTAANYNPNANTDDGTCIATVLGCTDAQMFNYDSLANTDDGSCIAVLLGCTDSTAFNYSATANTDDGSCVAVALGCMDSTQFNYDPNANTDDSSCIPFINGCTDPNAFNYDVTVNTEDGTCVPYIYGCTDPTAFNYDSTVNTDNGSCTPVILGCTDPTAFNFDSNANTDNDSCVPVINGCTDNDPDTNGGVASNYSSQANTDDGSCTYPVYGCTDGDAYNYDPLADTNDGSCQDVVNGCTDPTAFNYNSSANTDDGSCQAIVLGCTDATAYNYNANANTNDPDNPCVAVALGCIDPDACNFDNLANTSDGSCYFSSTSTNCDGSCTAGYIDIDDGLGCVPVILGCTDSSAFNYNNLANADDSTCVPYIYGCMDENAYNYDATANTNDPDNPCIAVVDGCTDPTAVNYDSLANVDDGSCIAVVLGCMDSNYSNYDSNANTDNGSCSGLLGCTDSTAVNYDPLATVDDGFCAYDIGCTDWQKNNTADYLPSMKPWVLAYFEGGPLSSPYITSNHTNDTTFFSGVGNIASGVHHYADSSADGYSVVNSIGFLSSTLPIFIVTTSPQCSSNKSSGGIMFRMKPKIGSAFWWQIWDENNSQWISNSKTFPTANMTSGWDMYRSDNQTPMHYVANYNVRANGNNPGSDFQVWSGSNMTDATTNNVPNSGVMLNQCLPNGYGLGFGNYKLVIYYNETWTQETGNPYLHSNIQWDDNNFNRGGVFSCPLEIDFSVGLSSTSPTGPAVHNGKLDVI